MISQALDQTNFSIVTGWAYSKRGPVTIRVEADGFEPFVIIPGIHRNDVEIPLGLKLNERATGFAFFPFQLWGAARGRLNVRLIMDDGGKPFSRDLILYAPNEPEVSPTLPRAPFPAKIFASMRAAEPTLGSIKEWRLPEMKAATDALCFLIARGDRLDVPLMRYRRYLESMRAVSKFAISNMLPYNTRSKMGAKDFWTLGTDLGEHMSLAHYLYCLSSHGVVGGVAEFGCFKGLSSSVLSLACAQLGRKLHIYDSFNGLPPSESPYYAAAEFRGSFDEVRENIERFGAIGACEFHPGFFSESVAVRTPTPLCMAWVDVDLEVSASDMVAIFDDLSPQGGVISNEAHPHFYEAGEIVEGRHADAVLPVLRDALQVRFGPVRGDHLANCSGSLYALNSGLPALPWAQIERILNAA